MALFQKPAGDSRAGEADGGGPLPLSPEEVAKLDEEAWYARVYRGEEVPQLTVRAVMTGAVVGFLLAFTNVYILLKTSWCVNVALTACIVSFSSWTLLVKLRIARKPLTLLENNCMQSTASAAGYSTGNVTGTALPALLLLSVTPALPGGRQMPWPALAGWVFLVATLGVVVAIPMKRGMINHDRLKFPSGLAAAETLHSLYSKGTEAAAKGRALFGAAVAASVTPLLTDLRIRRGATLLPAVSRALDWLPGRGVDPRTGVRLLPSDWTMLLDHKLLVIAVGMIAGMRLCASMALGGVLLAFLLGPAGLRAGAVTDPGQAWLQIGLWLGAPMLLTAGLLSAGRSLRAVSGGRRGLASQSSAEVPASVFAAGVAVAGTAVTIMASVFFRIPWYLGVAAIAISFILSLAACRANGESDINPLGAVASLTQFIFGVLMPHSPGANLMTAGISSSSAVSSGDLLTDWKAGYLLGASPRRQFVAQLLGVVPGTLASVLCYHLLIPDARVMTGSAPEFPAPAAQMWLATARLMTEGLGTLHPLARQAIVWGALIGLALALLERLPARYHRWFPSATGVGMGLLLPFQYPLSFFIGAVVAWAWARRSRLHAERYTIPIASGVIAGESLMGVLVATLNNFVLRR
jgi:uncharacterized oligopeptide transporter (OPT) family protein